MMKDESPGNGDPDSRRGAAEVAVATRLRQLRLEQGLTLSRLAADAGCSSAFLSRVENHRISIPIATLEKLADILGVAIGAFFEEPEDRVRITLIRRGEGPKGRLRGPRGFAFEMLAAEKKGKLMEPIIIDVASVKRATTPMPHSGEEFNYVLDGECDLIYGKETIRLRQGDAAYYDASVPHAARAKPGTSCRLLVVVASRDYLFHGDLNRLLSDSSRR